MAKGLRSKAGLGPLKDVEKLESLKLAVSYTLVIMEIEEWSRSGNTYFVSSPFTKWFPTLTPFTADRARTQYQILQPDLHDATLHKGSRIKVNGSNYHQTVQVNFKSDGDNEKSYLSSWFT